MLKRIVELYVPIGLFVEGNGTAKYDSDRKFVIGL